MPHPVSSTMSPSGGGNFSNVTTGVPAITTISEELLPALLNIFAIILMGYLVGVFKLLPREAVRVMSKTAGMFLLPVLLFCGLATIDFYGPVFDSLKIFLISISISKAIVYVVVVVLCLLTDRSADKWGKAGIRGIFVTQQNDFSLGLPIFTALYAKTQPQFISLLFLAAPISLVVLNPLAFVMMEYANTRKKNIKFGCKTLLKILLKVPSTTFAYLRPILALLTRRYACRWLNLECLTKRQRIAVDLVVHWTRILLPLC